MRMTAYMALLAENQPWNLIAFMVVPMVLAETLVAAEFFLLLGASPEKDRCLKSFTRTVGIVLAAYYLGLLVYFVLTVLGSIAWQGWIDVTAIAAFALAVLPAFAVALYGLDLSRQKLKRHFVALIAYLILAHVAMVFGMLDPGLGGVQAQETEHTMVHHHHH
jgi:hypothetical protein